MKLNICIYKLIPNPKLEPIFYFKLSSQYIRLSWEISKSKQPVEKLDDREISWNHVGVKKIQELCEWRKKTNSVQCEKNYWRFVAYICILFLWKVRSRIVLMKTVLCWKMLFFSLRLFSSKLKIDSNSKSIRIALPKFIAA